MENQLNTKIFLVDDDDFSLNIYQQGLNNLGYSDVTIFNNGVDCLNNLNQKPEVIFLDHNMDVLTGFEVLKKIKRADPNIHVVMVSAQENMKTAVDALKYGAFDYIIKDDDVSNKMQRVLERTFQIKEEIKRQTPTLFQKLLSIF